MSLSEALYQCGCGFTGNLSSVIGHQNRRQQKRETGKFPECQGDPVAVESEGEDEDELESEVPAPSAPAAAVPKPNGAVVAEPVAETPKRKGRPPAALKIPTFIPTLYRESVQVSPVMRTLFDSLRREHESLRGMDFAAWIEQSTLRYWNQVHGYRVSVVIESPEGELEGVGENGSA